MPLESLTLITLNDLPHEGVAHRGQPAPRAAAAARSRRAGGASLAPCRGHAEHRGVVVAERRAEVRVDGRCSRIRAGGASLHWLGHTGRKLRATAARASDRERIVGTAASRPPTVQLLQLLLLWWPCADSLRVFVALLAYHVLQVVAAIRELRAPARLSGAVREGVCGRHRRRDLIVGVGRTRTRRRLPIEPWRPRFAAGVVRSPLAALRRTLWFHLWHGNRRAWQPRLQDGWTLRRRGWRGCEACWRCGSLQRLFHLAVYALKDGLELP